jgi:hypothetical protein
MPSFAVERYEYCEYFSGSGVIACLVLYRNEQLTFVRFRTADWQGYNGLSNYATTVIFNEHLQPADPHSPGVMNFVQALASEAALQQKCRDRANGQGAKETGVPVTCAKVIQGAQFHLSNGKVNGGGNGVKPPPEPAKPPARQRKVRPKEADIHSLKPVRSIAGLTLADFLHDR